MALFFRISSILSIILLLITAPLAFAADENPDLLGSALAFAAASGKPAEVKELLDKGANPDKSFNSAGVPALALAVQRNDDQWEAVAKTLLDAGANVNVIDTGGQTPLFYAAKADLPQSVTFLLERGASLEQLDSTNHNARTAAHEAGKFKIVTLMDEFVKAKHDKVMKQYEERNAEVAERNRQIAQRNDELKKRNEDITRQNEQIKATLEEKAQKDAAKKEQLRAAAEIAARESRQEAADVARLEARSKPKEVDTNALQKVIRDLSYHSCAVEYWKFCRSNRVQTDISREDVNIQIEAHDTLAADAIERMKKDFGAKEGYINRIIDPSVKQINDELSVHATNANLKAEGAGTKDDADARCGIIADQWEFTNTRPGSKARKDSKRKVNRLSFGDTNDHESAGELQTMEEASKANTVTQPVLQPSNNTVVQQPVETKTVIVRKGRGKMAPAKAGKKLDAKSRYHPQMVTRYNAGKPVASGKKKKK